MFGVIYLILAMLLGREIAGLLFSFERSGEGTGGNRLWLLLPLSFGAGTLVMSWAVYVISWLLAVLLQEERPLLYGNGAVMLAVLFLLFFLYYSRSQNKKKDPEASSGGGLIADRRLLYREIAFFSVLGIFLFWIMFYVFYIKDGVLYSGFTVFGDYAPHVSMMRSFSLEANFPTQYPHFGGEDVKYHFMFQFLVGNLEYLGIRLDWAYNLVSVFSLEGFLMLLYMISWRVTGRFVCGALAGILFFFRSGTAFFRFAWEHFRAGDLLATLETNTAFIGYTPNENWGLYCFNVYLNQRHLAFGMLLVAAAVWFYLDWVEAGAAHPEKGFLWMKDRLFTAEAWKSRNLPMAILLGILLGMGAFWNGAAVIGGLLILLGFGLFSDGKVDYAVTAAFAVLLSVAQSRSFINGSAISFSFRWGFLSEDKSLLGVLLFFLEISGVFYVGLLILGRFLERRQRVILAAFLFPVSFAFLFSLTPDIAVNHKYIMISQAFLGMFWAWALAACWKKRALGRLFAAALALCLVITGAYEFVVILKDNGSGHRVGVSMTSSTTEWLTEHLDSRDLVLTPEYSINEITVSGIMMYLGWPYYAWSAGYDTYYRAAVATEIYTTEDPARLREMVSREEITYIIFEEGMTFEGQNGREDIIAECYPLVYHSEDGRIRIYEA